MTTLPPPGAFPPTTVPPSPIPIPGKDNPTTITPPPQLGVRVQMTTLPHRSERSTQECPHEVDFEIRRNYGGQTPFREQGSLPSKKLRVENSTSQVVEFHGHKIRNSVFRANSIVSWPACPREKTSSPSVLRKYRFHPPAPYTVTPILNVTSFLRSNRGLDDHTRIASSRDTSDPWWL